MDRSLTTAWLLDERRATLRTARLQAACDTRSLDEGFHSLRMAGEPCDGSLWQITSPLQFDGPNPLVEAYVRLNDLVVAHAATPKFPFATQLDWRLAQSDNDMLSIATIVSVQTDLLDTHPVIEVSCELPTDDVLLLSAKDGDVGPFSVFLPASLPEDATPPLVLLRLRGIELTYAEALDPSDFCGLRLLRNKNDTVRCTWRLFLHFLEKGVIRRSRLCSMLLPRENDVEHAGRGFQSFLASKLPLTA